jgi:PhnB protein
MAHVSIYLNFMGNAEEAFNHYKKVFGTEFSNPLMRFKDMPPQDGAPPLPEADKNKVMHVALPILGGIQIMATDMLESMGQKLIEGNNFTISLNPDTGEEADRCTTSYQKAEQKQWHHMMNSGDTGVLAKTSLASAGCLMLLNRNNLLFSVSAGLTLQTLIINHTT